jgi:hypothetical protein
MARPIHGSAALHMATEKHASAAQADVRIAATTAYASTARIDELRATEYRHLDRDGRVYLAYAGAGVAARAQIAHHDRLLSGLYSTPVGAATPSSGVAGSAIRTRRIPPPSRPAVHWSSRPGARCSTSSAPTQPTWTGPADIRLPPRIRC